MICNCYICSSMFFYLVWVTEQYVHFHLLASHLHATYSSSVHVVIHLYLCHSALATILNDAKAAAEDTAEACTPCMDDSVVMLALAIFISSAPKEVIIVADLQKKCISVFNRCLKSSNMQVRNAKFKKPVRLL